MWLSVIWRNPLKNHNGCVPPPELLQEFLPWTGKYIFEKAGTTKFQAEYIQSIHREVSGNSAVKKCNSKHKRRSFTSPPHVTKALWKTNQRTDLACSIQQQWDACPSPLSSTLPEWDCTRKNLTLIVDIPATCGLQAPNFRRSRHTGTAIIW